MFQFHSELRIETEGVDCFPPRGGAGEVHIVRLGLSPQFLEFKNIRRGESYWGDRGVGFGRKGSGNRGDNPDRLEDGSWFKENYPGYN